MSFLDIRLGKDDDDDLLSSISASLQAYNLNDSASSTGTQLSISTPTTQALHEEPSAPEQGSMQTQTQERATADSDAACNASIASTVGLGHLSSDELEKYLASASRTRTVRRMLKDRGFKLPPVRAGGEGMADEVVGEADEGAETEGEETIEEEPMVEDEEANAVGDARSGGKPVAQEQGTDVAAEEGLSEPGKGKEEAAALGGWADVSGTAPKRSRAKKVERRWSDVAAARPFSPRQGPLSENGQTRWSNVGAIRPFSPSQTSGLLSPISPDTDVDTGSTASTILIHDRNDVSRWTSAPLFQPGSNTAGSIRATPIPELMPGHSDRSYVHRPLPPIDPYDQGPLIHSLNHSISQHATQMHTLDGIMRTLAGQRAMASFELARIYEEAWRAGLEITTDGYVATEGEVRAGRVWRPVGWLGTGWGDGRAFEMTRDSEEQVSEVVQALEVRAAEEPASMANEEEWPLVGAERPASG